MTEILLQAFIFLLAAVIAVPVAKRLGLGSVLGYLLAGVVIGPLLGVVGTQESVTLQHYAEFGVVMMLFLVGLELEPALLWRMRMRLLGLGGLQVALTAAAFTFIAMQFGLVLRNAIAVGLLLSLSSTAIVLQTFQEKGLTRTDGGRGAFSVLLFQDIAVIPMLALIPLLALPELVSEAAGAHANDGHHGLSLVEGLSGWSYALVVIGAIATVIIAGHYLSRPLFRFIADANLREAFTAAALMLVIGIAVLMSLVGLSPALGTFLAGVVLANSEFRHQLEATIEPFKGLLLGLFFITVGASVRFPVLVDNAALVMALTATVIVVKLLILFLLALVFRLRRADGWLFTLSLAQAGEFGFVLISYATQNSVLPGEQVPILSLVVALSMFLTPLLFIAFDRFVLPRYADNDSQRDADTIEEQGVAIIAGTGRFGQIVNRLLRANGFSTVVLDRTPAQVENMRQINVKAYYGDATSPELLHAAGVDEAALFVVAIDDPEQSLQLVHHLKHDHPRLKILARAYDRGHLYALREAGVDLAISETYHSALQLGKAALSALGCDPQESDKRAAAFDRAEDRGREALYEKWLQKSDGERFGRDFRSLFIELEEALHELMQGDGDGEQPLARELGPEESERSA